MDRRLDGRYVGNDFKVKRVATGIGYQDGNYVPKVAKATFDTAALDSSGVANTTIAAHGLAVYIPNKAVVTRAWYEVNTTFTSATDAATIALKVNSANDLKSAVAISNGANAWDASIVDGIPVDTAATRIKITAERELTATVAVEALTAGKLTLFVEYIEAQ
jgi:hypothetical protein